MPAKKPLASISDFSPGLNTRDPKFRLPLGAGSVYENLWPYRGSLKNPPGYTRLSKTEFNAPAVLLDGGVWMRSLVDAAGSDVGLIPGSGEDAALEGWFRPDAVKEYNTILFKGTGDPGTGPTYNFANFDYWLYYDLVTASTPTLVFAWSDGTAATDTTVAPGGALTLEVGTAYYFYVGLTHSVGSAETQVTLLVREFGGAEVALSEVTGTGVTMADNAYDLYVGASKATTPVIVSKYAENPLIGVVQELRFWDDQRPSGERDATYNAALTSTEQGDADLRAYFPLTGSGPIDFADAVGAANDIEVEPKDHTRGDELVKATGASLKLNGRDDGFAIENSYWYRKPVANDDGEYPMWDSWFAGMTVTADDTSDFKTLLHWTHTAQGDFVTTQSVSGSVPGSDASKTTGTVGAGAEQAIVCLDIFDDGANPQFRFTWFADDGDYAVVLSTISGGIVAGTTYDVLVSRTGVSGFEAIGIYIDGVFDDSQVTTGLASQSSYRTLDDPVSSAAKYWMTVGRCIKQIRKAENVHADPNDVDVEYDLSRSFDGQIDNLTIGHFDSSSVDTGTLAAYVAEFLTTNSFDRTTVTSTDAIILSHWPCDEAGGDVVVDVGQVQNNIFLSSDPGHRMAESLSTTVEKDKLHALFEHTYVDPGSAATKKIVGITTSSAYSLNETSGAWTLIGEGLRNDDGDLVQHAQFRNSRILTSSSSGNGHLHKENLWRLSIQPPVGPVPWGLTDQNADEGKLTTGRYIYGWRFISRITGKVSPLGAISTVNIRCERANVEFGTGAEINQTSAFVPGGATNADPPPLPQPEVGVAQKDPYDLSTFLSVTNPNPNNIRFQIQAWAYPEEDGPEATDKDPKWAKYRLANKDGGGVFDVVGDFSESDSMKNEEFKTWLEAQPKSDRRYYWESAPDGTHKIKSSFVGSAARLKVSDSDNVDFNNKSIVQFLYVPSGGSVFELPDGGSLIPGDNEAGVSFIGTGVTGHGQKIPFSDDPQVTHVQLCRTNVDGEELRVLVEVPNKTEDLKDVIEDDFNFGEVVDESLVAVPACKYVTMLGDRYLYFGDPDEPQRMYVTNVQDPFNVPNYGIVDFYDGRTLELTAASAAEDIVILFKRDMTFLLTPPQDPNFPFRVDVRYQDQGCTSPYGIASFRGIVEYPEDQGFFRFDSESEKYISRWIEPTWQAISNANRDLISAVHFVDNEVVMFAVPTGDSSIDGAVVNDEVLAHFYLNGEYGWVRLTGMYVRFFALVTGPNGNDIIYLVDHNGFVSVFNDGDLYGNGDSGSPTTPSSRTVLTGGTNDSTHVTIEEADPATLPAGYLGLPITLVRADGSRETRYSKAFVDQAGSPNLAIIEVDHAWDGAAPVVTDDTVLIGSVEASWRSGAMVLGGAGVINVLNDILIRKETPSDSPAVTVAWRGLGKMRNNQESPDFSATKTLSTTSEDDVIATAADSNRGDRFEIQIENKGVIPTVDIHEISLLFTPGERGSY